MSAPPPQKLPTQETEAPILAAHPPAPPPKGPSKGQLIALATPTLVILLLMSFSILWYVPTHVHLDLATSRLAFTPGGEKPGEILNLSVTFASLTLEECGTVTFPAESLEIADPALLEPAKRADEVPRFPPEAWRRLPSPSSVKFSCRDPGAKLTFQAPGRSGEGVGILDRLHVSPGREVIVEVPPDPEPTVNLKIVEPRKLDLVAVGPEVEVVADLTQPEGITVPFPGSPQTYRARLPESRRTVEISSGAEGLTLILTPPRQSSAEVFSEELNFPLASVEILTEDLDGNLISPLRDQATLSYPKFPNVPAAILKRGELIGLEGLSQARLLSLSVDKVKDEKGNERSALRASFDGIVKRAKGKAGEFPRDHRLTLFDTFRHSSRWGWIIAALAWAVPTTWAGFEAWKKLQE